ncbi:type I polyketide synthase [Paenibacillus hexagrammi]|uniref:Polyketide synthase dehydratase domain-containing protein n=1 Tax=Paenibacillus hexagrammi TaxID=2908839 RepID=A0ABY3SLF1_9BACL|nr:type I polyketide synthase [Paenibacillus sp. YPD9-1]UJF34781.1 polyketide synthase dehydratase domain-containing protein [Paenibacillus sp. YPD9-1]
MGTGVKQEDYLTLLNNSLQTIKKLKSDLDKHKKGNEPIAVIGMGCRFPGGCQDPQSFWDFLQENGDGIVEVPGNRWNVDDFYDQNRDASGKMYLKEAGFLQEDVGAFDARFFGISPREASEMDPQQRLLLEVSWEALESAGICPDSIRGTQTGVFVGMIGSEYALLPRARKDNNPYTLTGVMSNIASGRISYMLGINGPSISIDTACSSSLVAVHLACESLQREETSLALAGGVNLLLSPEGFVSLCGLNALAEDGRCKTFDASGDGYGRGEGCGVVVLKRLSDAMRDNDPILAVIKGSGVNQDGPGSGLTVPNGAAQRELISKTLEKAGVLPSEVGYLEAHGTGTPLGDPIEFQALTEVFGKDGNRKDPLIIGSVKSNIGHLEGAAGIAGLIKLVLCIQNKKISANRHFHTVNPRIHLEKIPAVVPDSAISWEKGEKPLIAGISSYGFSGTNAHVIVAEPPRTADTGEISGRVSIERPLHILALSAKDDSALIQLVSKYEKYFEGNSDENLADICFTANAGRNHFSHRTAFYAQSLEHMKSQLSEYGSKLGAGRVDHKNKEKSNPKLVFLCNDGISKDAAKALYETQPVFRETLLLCDEQQKQMTDISFLPYILNDSLLLNSGSLGSMNQVVSFSLQLGLLQVWDSWGVKPAALLGSGIGEFAAACAAGVMSIHTALAFILEHEGFEVKAGASHTLDQPRIRLYSGSTGRSVDKQEAVSGLYWAKVLDAEPDIRKGIQSLADKGFRHFLEIGQGISPDVQKDIVSYSGGQYFTYSNEENIWDRLLHVLGQLYGLGLDINWHGFDLGYTRRKVLLPTYPFQRKHYWCETLPYQESPMVKMTANHEGKSGGSFLDGRMVYSPLKEKQIEYLLSLDIAPDLKDTHGVVHVGYYLEILCRAVGKIYGNSFHVKAMEFLSALVIPEHGMVNFSLTLSQGDHGEIEFAFYSSENGSHWNKHVNGSLLLGKKDLMLPVREDLEKELKIRCTEQYSGSEFYRQVQEERGLSLGKSVQWIGHVWTTEGESLARFQPPAGIETRNEYKMGIHPGVLDACAQLFHAALPKNRVRDYKYMVTKWEGFAFNYQPDIQELWCHVVLEEVQEASNELKGVFRLFDQNGNLIARIHSGLMKGLSKEREKAFKKQLEKAEEAKDAENDFEVIKSLKRTGLEQWEGIIQEYLQGVFASIFEMPISEMDINESLMNVGMDSLVGIEAKVKIEKELGIFVPIEIFIQGSSISEIAEFILPLLSVQPDRVASMDENQAALHVKKDIHLWIAHRKSNPLAKMKLFCFPYGSGGGASLYREWQAKLPDYIEVCPIQLPGKENRVKEKAFDQMDRAVEVMKEVLLPELDRPYAFYGHSAGALLVYCLAYRLWKEIDNKPMHLFVGAYSSPTILPNPLISFTREKFKNIGYGDIPGPDILSSISPEQYEDMVNVITSENDVNQELVRLYLPTRLAELQMVNSYRAAEEAGFDVPITAIHGKRDDKVQEHEMYAWKELTQGTFELHEVSGDHLFLREDQNQEQLLEIISQDLEKYVYHHIRDKG